MSLARLRLGIQHISFLVLMYGGRVGIRLGSALPCFSCPFVPNCGGYCYLMGLQGYIGFGMNFTLMLGFGALQALGWFALFCLLTTLFGKIWCGWVCPFGLVQDWLTSVRRFLRIRARRFTPEGEGKRTTVRYALLACIVIIPPLATVGVLHEDFYLPFCNICPGKSILPLFAGETRYLALNLDNAVSLCFSAALMIVMGITLTGMFFKERFFCAFCPLLTLIHLLEPVTLLRLVKEPEACVGCGNCARVCPMDIEAVYKEKKSSSVRSGECLDCGRCAESCPSESALGLKFFRLKLFSSSRAYVSKMGREP